MNGESCSQPTSIMGHRVLNTAQMSIDARENEPRNLDFDPPQNNRICDMAEVHQLVQAFCISVTCVLCTHIYIYIYIYIYR